MYYLPLGENVLALTERYCRDEPGQLTASPPGWQGENVETSSREDLMVYFVA